MMPCLCSGIRFHVSPYSRHRAGLAGGTEDSLPGAAYPWRWPKEWRVVCCTWCQGAAGAAGAGAQQHRQHRAQGSAVSCSLPSRGHCPGHRAQLASQTQASSTAGVCVTPGPVLSCTGDVALGGTLCFPCPARGFRASLQHSPAEVRACTRHRGGQEGQGQAAQGTCRVLVTLQALIRISAVFTEWM